MKFQPLGNFSDFINESLLVDSAAIEIDKQLIERSQKGDRVAQRALYLKYGKAMYNLSLRMLGTKMDAEDAVQEAFVVAFQGLANFQGRSTFGAWLKRIVINKCADQLRKKKIVTVEGEEYLIAPLAEKEFNYCNFSVEQVHSAIKKLPKGCGAVITLSLMEGYDHEEIGHILNISKGTSKSQLSRAKRLLRDTLLNKNLN